MIMSELETFRSVRAQIVIIFVCSSRAQTLKQNEFVSVQTCLEHFYLNSHFGIGNCYNYRI